MNGRLSGHTHANGAFLAVGPCFDERVLGKMREARVTHLDSTYNPENVNQGMSACIERDHGVMTTCSTSCRLLRRDSSTIYDEGIEERAGGSPPAGRQTRSLAAQDTRRHLGNPPRRLRSLRRLLLCSNSEVGLTYPPK